MAAEEDNFDDTGMLRGETAQAVLEIDTLAPMTDAEEAAAQQRWGGDYRTWPTLQQQQWLRRFPEDGREEYIDSRTWTLYQVRLNSTAAGLGREEEERAVRELEMLAPLSQAEQDWTARQFSSTDPSNWPSLARRRYIRGLDRSQWIGELARLEPGGLPGRRNTSCRACELSNDDDYCDADPEIGLGCSRCRQRNRRCFVGGRELTDRPQPDRNFRLKCQPCQQSGEDCEWFAAPINLHYVCGNCTRKGMPCRPQEEGAPDMGEAPPELESDVAANHPAIHRPAAMGQGGAFASTGPSQGHTATRRTQRQRGKRSRPGQRDSARPPPAYQGAGGQTAGQQSSSNQAGPSSGQVQSSQLFFPVEERRRKLPGGRYTMEEAPLSDAERARLQKRQLIQSNMNKCRTCLLNEVKNSLCSRMSVPNPGNVACDRCDRLGIECVDPVNGTIFQPRMELTGTGRRNLLTFWPCNNCNANSLCCDRSRSCAQCRTRGIECTDARRAQNTFRHGTGFGTTQPRYFLAMGYGPWGIGSQRPPGRPDLPGPMDRPFFVTRGHPGEIPARQEFLDHLAENQGQLNLSDFDLTVPGPPYVGTPRTPPGQTGQSIPPEEGASIFNSPEQPGAERSPASRRSGGSNAAVAGPSQQQVPDGPPEQWHVQDPNNIGLPYQRSPDSSNPAQYFPPFQAPSPEQTQVDPNLIDPALMDDGPGDLGDIELPPILPVDDDVQQRRSPSPGPVGGPMAQPDGLFSMVNFREKALATIPSDSTTDPEYLEFNWTCMEGLPVTEDIVLQCQNDSFGRKCADLGHQPPEGFSFYVCDPCNDSSRSTIRPWRWQREDIMAMRAYACATCLLSIKYGQNPFAGTGTNIFGGVRQNPDSVAVEVDGRRIGGLHGRDLLPLTGCRCGSKLVLARLCTGHRDGHLVNVKAQAARMSEYRLNQYGFKICPVCMRFGGVDHYNFQAVEGGSLQEDILAYACMICHSFVLAQGEWPASRQRLMDVIPMPQIPAAPRQVEEVA
ncbi:hypothetical protein VP1G_02468 [Cytospora mali]|uniref:Zn(2)-C6 fungal-type domain-containing protein n=1 Tax=Cytospora mali TaxID=578113 RepID=A0A194UUB7_CYTMA|nr:hypothetical protein VP1G_02468 [Valsa mali var. pyri (nom. inval.)]